MDDLIKQVEVARESVKWKDHLDEVAIKTMIGVDTADSIDKTVAVVRGTNKAVLRCALLKLHLAGIPVVVIDKTKAENIYPCDDSIAICPTEFHAIKIQEQYNECKIPSSDNSFRGGSRKKGGKIGYSRK